MSPRALLILASAAGAMCAWPMLGQAVAEERAIEFVRALQENGYEDVAVDYLQWLEKRPQLSPELRDVMDLEMSNSLRGAAKYAFDAADHERLMGEAQKRLSKFLKERPDHPQAVAAMVSWGNLTRDRALQKLRLAKSAEDKPQQAKHLMEAREGLQEASQQFKQARDKFQERLAELTSSSKKPNRREDRAAATQRQRWETEWLDARAQIALVDYYLAQTYTDPNDATRKTTLQSAAKAFDEIYQANRLTNMGLYAHMWQGKALEELGDLQTAWDIYEEVLANAPDPGQAQAANGLEPLFAQVEHFRLLILAKRDSERFLAEAAQWLQLYRVLRRTEGYQGISLELAKAHLALAEKATAAEKNKHFADAMSVLNEMGRINSPYQQEAILLRRKHSKTSSAAEPASQSEAIALGNAAAAAGQWSEASTHFRRALEMVEKTKPRDTNRFAEVRNALAQTEYMLAREQFGNGRFDECWTATGKLLQEFADTSIAPMASALAVSAALNLYVASAPEQRGAALKRLEEIAKATIDKWPDKPEADDARMALGQASLVIGKIDEALTVFESVNPKSDRHPSALYLAGRTYWQRYRLQKAKAEGDQSEGLGAADRAKAMEKVNASFLAQKKSVDAGKPLPRSLIDAQLLLGEMHLEGNQAKEAAELLQPLVELVKGQKPQELDNTTLRVFVGAVRAHVMRNDLEKAGEVGTLLVDLGPDNPVVNNVLIEFAKLLNAERRQAEAAATQSGGEADKGKLASVQGLLAEVLKKLSVRKELSPADMVFVAETCDAIGMRDEPRILYERFLERDKSDEQFHRMAAKGVTRVRAQLVGLLAKKGSYEEAIKQVKQLAADNPRALEPLMEQGRILQSWAEKDPSHYDEAVAHWAMLRNKLQSMKKKPPDYFEVTYNLAKCLHDHAWSRRVNDKSAAEKQVTQATQLLKSTLVLSPSLSGPDMVARYNKLLQETVELLKDLGADQSSGKAAAKKS